MKKLRHLLGMLLLLGTSGVQAQDFTLSQIREFPGSGSRGLPVIVGGTPFAVMGGSATLSLGSSDRLLQFQTASAPDSFTPEFALTTSSTSVVVAGRLRAFSVGLDRVAAFRINLTTEAIDWSFIEPLRSVSTRPLEVIDTGVSLVLAAAVEGGVAAIALNPSTGVEQFRTAVATTHREASIARDGAENVYLLANRITANGPRLFVRSVDAAGFFRWEREYPLAGTGHEGFSFTIPLLMVAHDFPSRQSHVVELDLSNGDLIRSFTVSSANSAFLTPPVSLRSGGQLLMHFFQDGGRRRLTLNLNLFTGTVQNLGANVIDRSVALFAGVPVFHVQNRETQNLELHPESTWVPTALSTGSNLHSSILNDAARNRLITVITASSAGIPRLMEIIPKPIARDDAIEAFFNEQQITFDPTDNDLAATNADIEILTQPEGGTVSQNNDGTLTFTAVGAKHQTETFEYRLTRGNLSSVAVVKIFRQPVGIGLELSSIRVKGGTVVTGKVLMSGPRQGAPQALELFENTTATALASPTVQLLPGKSESEVFTIFTARVREPVRAIITADEGNFSVEEFAFLDIDPPFITSLEPVETTVVGGAPAQFRVVMDAPAPTGGMPINVSDNSTAIAVPTVIVVPAALTSTIFSAPTAVVTSSRTAVITATSNGITRSTTIAIVGVSMALDPTSVVGGNSTTGTITLTSNAIVNSVVFDLSDNSTAVVPQTPTAIVPAGFRTGTFTVLTVPVTSTRSATISASKGGVVRSATMTVRVAALQSILVSPSQVVGGNPFAGLVSLDGRAAGAGLTISLSSAAVFAQIPSSLSIPGGQTQGLFVGTTTRPTTTLMIVISASLNGITRATTIIVSP